MSRPVLVTGAAGFIGSHLCDALAAHHQVIAVDDFSSGSMSNLTAAASRGAQVMEMDVAGAAFRDLVLAERPRVVFHLAAQMDVRKSVQGPLDDARTNVLGTVNVAEAGRAAGVERVVFTSSGGTVYGEAEVIPTPETAPLRPVAPYGAAKISGETYLGAYGRLHGIGHVVLRLGNVYGPRQEPHGEAGVVSMFGGRLLAGEATDIYGDGTSTRDYVAVADVVDALVRCADGRADGRTLNVGTGVGTSVRELHSLLASCAGADDDPSFRPPRLGELHTNVLDVGLAAEVLGWRPETTLRDGLAATLEWLRTSSAGRST